MNQFPNFEDRKHVSKAVLILLLAMATQPTLAQTATTPSQSPLLVNPTGAKPNLMLTMDTSGSMAFPYHETYDISGSATASALRGNEWLAQRSANVNPVYYDPRVNYTNRVNPDKTEITPTDGITFISNQTSTPFEYYARFNGTTFETATTITANNSTKNGGAPGTNAVNLPTTSTAGSYYLRNSYPTVPQHVTYSTAATAVGNIFTWGVCTDVITSGNQEVGCTTTAATATNVIAGDTSTTYTLPAGHDREAACPGGICKYDEEVRNILTWYRYYSTRATAAATAIGQALANSDYYNNIRVGYMTINRPAGTSSLSSSNTIVPGTNGENQVFSRGVRMLNGTNTDSTNLFDNLYSLRISGGTPLHNAVDQTANYYKIGTGVSENPYRTDPTSSTSATNPVLSCRRNFNLLFSDGSWTAAWSTNAGDNSDFTNGPTFTSSDGATFQYLATGINTVSGRKAYVPYGGSATGGLADLTARYYWTEDFSTLANNVSTDTDNGKPTFWQNMATYTVGYQIKPSGETSGATSGLTFKQIDDYATAATLNGYASSTKPTWPTGAMASQVDAKRVDDFIQAGYTGGGKGFSASSAKEVKDVFSIILSDVLNASGTDAGVAVSSSSSGTTTLAGSLKYKVSYRTRTNYGDVTAYLLDADGTASTSANWSANAQMPAAKDRNVFTMSGQTSPEPLKNNFSTLSADIRASLSVGDETLTRISSGSGFVDYIRGDDTALDANGSLFRQRSGILGAMVNPPSTYMGGSSYINYANSKSTVTGFGDFKAYGIEKAAAPATLVVATNAGAANVLDATTGVELAAFMPRRSLSHMLSNAAEDYSFKYVLDGPLSENDFYDTVAKEWRHIAVGSGGRGEKLVYALRSPINKDSSGNYNRQPTVDDFLWETGPTDLPQGSTQTASNMLNSTALTVGYMSNEARMGQTENGTWVVALNSGHYNGNTDGSKHGLLLLDPRNGDVVQRIPLPNGYDAGRGLSGITMIRNDDLRIVGAYAGDGNGNLWRFTLTGAENTWKVAYNKPLYTTQDNRPIYGHPAWQVHPEGGAIVVIATGMLLEEADISDTTEKESIYGIWDPTAIDGTEVTGFTTRLTSKLLTQSVTTSASATVGTRNYYSTSENTIDWTQHEGWRLALGWKSEGERSLTGVVNLYSNVLIATAVVAEQADDDLESCTVSSSVTNFLYSLKALDGSLTSSFDTDGNGKPDDVSVVEVTEGGFTRGNSLFSPADSIAAAAGDDAPYDGSRGEKTSKDCSDDPSYLTGTTDSSLKLFSNCTSTAWSRIQYQLSAPPAKN